MNFYKYCDFPGTDHELLALDGGTHFDKRLVQLKVSRGSTEAVYRTPSFADSKYDLRAKYVASAAYIHGKPGSMCELFAAANWGATPGELRRIAAWQLLQGVNHFVPHAIHHLFRERSRYAAPPEQHYGLGGAVRELNDFIAKYAFISSQGEFAPSVKVEDITERVRRGEEDVENFFIFTDMLNHAGISYVIVPEGTAGAVRVGETLPALPEREFTFSGGDLLAMRRKMNGKHFLLVCNLWSEETLRGVLEFEGRKVELEITPGEIAVIGGDYEEFRSVSAVRERIALPFPAEAAFCAPNRIPFHYNSEFTVDEALQEPLRLLIPAELASEVFYDGKKVSDGKAVKCFDDEYVEFAVDGGKGKHSFFIPSWENRPLDLGKPNSTTGNDPGMPTDFKYYTPVYLDGEFDAEVTVEKAFDHKVYVSYYILQIFDPAVCEIALKPRRKVLDAASWAVQGQPFYSGSAVYKFDISSVQGAFMVETPDAAVKVEAFVDGKACGNTAMPPYRIDLGDISEGKVLELKVTNTYANEFEEYPAPSGLVGGASLIRP